MPAVGFVVALLAFAFAELTDEPTNFVLFSGQGSLGTVVARPEPFPSGR